MKSTIINKRREAVFGFAVLLAGLAISSLCLMPALLVTTVPESLFPSAQHERLFFDLLGIVCGCWLLSWVSAVNNWMVMARAGQWLGILLLCGEAALLVGVWHDVATHGSDYIGVWLSPLVVQTYLTGCFFGFFTLPSLTQNGNLRLTGLGTLAILLPWLFGRDAVIAGTQYLHGLFF